MKAEIKATGVGPIPGKALTQFTVLVNFNGPIEALTMTVTIPTADATEDRAIARAKELARLFCEQARA